MEEAAAAAAAAGAAQRQSSLKARRSVKPRNSSSSRKSGRRNVPLSTCDLAIPNVYAMAIYAFKAPTRPGVVEELERGLAEALDEYPEWAGRLCKDSSSSSSSSSSSCSSGLSGSVGSSKVVIDLNDDGVALMEASMDCCLQDLMPFNPCPLLFQLVPATKSVEELLLVQVTSFKCGGIVLGVAWHHRLADGQAFFSFMDNWSRLTRGAPLACSPFRDRSALNAGETAQPLQDDYLLLSPPQAPAPAPDPGAAKTPPLAARKFHFSMDLLQRIKRRAGGDSSTDEPASSTTRGVTTFESLTAHLWRCITKARGITGDTKTQIMIPMNGRSRLEPAIPESYFGNATFMPSSGTEAGELTSRPLCYAAQLVHGAIIKADSSYLRSALELMELQNRMMKDEEVAEVVVPPSMSPHVVVTSWVRFPLYDVDFGWGTPLYVGNVLDLYEGIMILLPSHTQDGSIDAVVALFEPEIETLQELCYRDDLL
ncbi:BAHD family acyltransferase, clade IV [Selaginella moellendorffii]|uniref:BAHD family acyltransferase, clade IV n=1 Tax=Selaginella moellendorffii TaxID=88036 RepID=D8QNP1_SELML|nr:shikimate O-hydroxycinnamoyltransferase isoform X1 [Selaginella moellendorffii]XP_024529181.1 shikimate O-hydroxycinnamoyltransferase isoform X1 [Selaginella moellendorffii]XP_024529187.1 shikimate O-hydroxycinnamoyltransferase isoform X1 [Selaginella moellendorffii]XP_024529192.1 shikimate O-hydroxycinnamoyltransferase isoform X1 [Selaginella moellendorffii]XP_024529200.1 shikimate O-hydroxycinnamoyltransferase isoform X1 [Selaginella moellendorffii]XP_024529207.1 shikimate O-hydroxycinnam|eukprot:XP_002960602.1 shikimate O-hydroxycinnamoyltransferase isoform X1 [Selaginella moellendorffii]